VYLSWSRNAVISTVAATALYQQVPVVSGGSMLSGRLHFYSRGAGLFLMGFSFQIVGTVHYLRQAFALQYVAIVLVLHSSP
jgi:hypothetical protein